MIQRMWAALRFLTVLPQPGDATVAIAKGLPVFPLVGGLIGVLSALVLKLLWVHVGHLAAVALVLLLELFLTRGLHWDGLLDTADGLFVLPPERALMVMRDPRVGGLGAVTGMVFLLLRFSLIASLPAAKVLPALVAAGVLGRWSLVFALERFPYARAEGLGTPFQAASPWSLPASSALALALLGLLAHSSRGALAALVSWLSVWLLGRMVTKRLGGLTGDVYGALSIVTDILVLLIFVWR